MKVTPEALADAAKQLGIPEAPGISGITTAGIDEVSAAITAVFNTYGAELQGLVNQADERIQGFIQNLYDSADSYLDTEQASANGIVHPVGTGGNGFSVNFIPSEFQVGVGEEFVTLTWQKLP